MKLNSLVSSHLLLAVGWSLAILTPFSARADQWDKKTILTLREQVQVQDRVLEPGRYVFKLLDSNADRHVVQIFNGDMSQCLDTIIAIPDYRLQPTGRSQFRFYETPSGYVKALKAWYYPGDNFGQEFTYPKHPMMLAMASVAAPPAVVVAPLPQPEPEAAAPAPAPEPVLQAPEPAPAEMAQNAPPSAPAQPEPAPQTRSLPKTASPYPLVALLGVMFFGAFGVLRLRRS